MIIKVIWPPPLESTNICAKSHSNPSHTDVMVTPCSYVTPVPKFELSGFSDFKDNYNVNHPNICLETQTHRPSINFTGGDEIDASGLCLIRKSQVFATLGP